MRSFRKRLSERHGLHRSCAQLPYPATKGAFWSNSGPGHSFRKGNRRDFLAIVFRTTGTTPPPSTPTAPARRAGRACCRGRESRRGRRRAPLRRRRRRSPFPWHLRSWRCAAGGRCLRRSRFLPDHLQGGHLLIRVVVPPAQRVDAGRNQDAFVLVEPDGALGDAADFGELAGGQQGRGGREIPPFGSIVTGLL